MNEVSDLGFEIPSKTFLLGEYIALQGGASLILASDPCFYASVIKDNRYGFHEKSPAGRLRRELGQKSIGYSFFDPHDGRGGFGRSTAEYLAVYLHNLVANQGLQNPIETILENLEDFVTQYQHNCGSDYKPSGADLVAQVCGGLCWYDGQGYQIEQLVWPFEGYDIFIFHTGKKLATHEHLKDLKKIDLQGLYPIMVAGRSALDQKNFSIFCDAINGYYDHLGELGLSDLSVKKGIMTLRQFPEVLAAKGCGAMGVDTLLVVAKSESLSKVKAYCFDLDFQFITSLSRAHQGACLRRPM